MTPRRTAAAVLAEVCAGFGLTLRALRQARSPRAKAARRAAILVLRLEPALNGRCRSARAVAALVRCNITTVQYWTLPEVREQQRLRSNRRHRLRRQAMGYKTLRGLRHAENMKRRKAMVEGVQNGVHPSPSICPPQMSPELEPVP